MRTDHGGWKRGEDVPDGDEEGTVVDDSIAREVSSEDVDPHGADLDKDGNERS